MIVLYVCSRYIQYTAVCKWMFNAICNLIDFLDEYV